MSLIELWNNARDQLEGKHVHQIIAFTGEGKLRDGNATSQEFRNFLGIAPSAFLKKYCDNCLAESFQDSGLVLQDVVNQIGARLGFQVENGPYRGSKNETGFDGIWRLPDGWSLIAEVKTTDAYRIDLGVLWKYRRELIEKGRIDEAKSAILIIVGRQDTGDLEAQIRGSRYAWDVRVISVDALLKMLALKEDVEEPNTIQKIHEILFPREFTRLDDIVDLVFSAAEDAKPTVQDADEIEGADPSKEATEKKFAPVAFHAECIERIQKALGCQLVKESRSRYQTSDGSVRVICAVSRRTVGKDMRKYWFVYHEYYQSLLDGADRGFYALGCGGADSILLIPMTDFIPWVPSLNTTVGENRTYSHVHVHERNGRFILQAKKGMPSQDLTRFLVV